MTREERSEYNRAYREANKARIRKCQREYYHRHKDKAKAYYQRNKEKINAYSREYYRDCKWQWQDIYRPRQIVKAAKEIK